MKEALEKQRLELEEKKRRLESGRPITPRKLQRREVLPSTSNDLSTFLPLVSSLWQQQLH